MPHVPTIPEGVSLDVALAAAGAVTLPITAVNSENNDHVDLGKFIRFDPATGNHANASVFISSGPVATPPPPTVVPSFVGQNVQDQPVQDFLLDNGATLDETAVDSTIHTDGQIVWQRELGIPVTPGITLHVRVARPTEWVDVPEFVNNMIDDLWIAQWEAANGVSLNIRERQHRIYGDGVIFGQSTRANTRVKRGSSIDLDVSKVRQQTTQGHGAPRLVPDPHNPGRLVPETAVTLSADEKLPRWLRHPVKTALRQN